MTASWSPSRHGAPTAGNPRSFFVTRESGPPLPGIANGAVVTVGTFDGVHRGHQRVLERLVARSRELALPGVVVTFEPHPLDIVNPAAAPPRLTVHPEKTMAFAASG